MAAAADIENTPMFCFQCEQTANREACTIRGVCSKDADVAALQDHLMWGLESLAVHALRAIEASIALPDGLHKLVAKGVFSTLTNVNFSPDDFARFIRECATMRDQVRNRTNVLPSATLPAVAEWVPAGSMAEMIAQAKAWRIPRRFATLGKDRACLQELLIYGVKGVAAYYFHALLLGEHSDAIEKFILKALAFVHKADPAVDELLGMCMECGTINLATIELLDKAHTTHFGHPAPTTVTWAKTPTSAKKGKCILVSGHDLHVLDKLLAATEGKGISVWTHGEMLPCNAYPRLHAHAHLAGHYGTAWQNQKREFDAFPGPVLMTTNCYLPAPKSYVDRVFFMSPVGGVDIKSCDENFDDLIKCALASPGFPEATETPASLTIGFARNTILNVAGTVIDAVKAGALKHIFLIGGCDGYEKERNYYTEFAEKVPKDCIILTLACGKFKINAGDYGTLGGLPRLLDVGQCNDAYSAIVVASALANAFNTDVNGLPLSIILSWFEQKAVAILLTLLSLGIKNIYVGPRVPAFFTPTILGVLVDKFQLHVTGTPDADLKTILKQ
eukprot:TRINITY_DN55_c0_g1_i17.p2 TRINITY_DN55_c0_g1~~TRINITY_DN55_c0_g1_i17.p2  ORF type:complete len:560 (-),score=179.91 TRINITY_DN55_c0_g1_i17:75-1754(-)